MRKAHFVFAISLGAWAAPCLAQREAHDPVFYVTPLLNAVRTDDARLVDDGSAFTLAAGFESLPNWNLELNLFRGTFEGAAGDDLQADGIGVNALRVFRRDARVAPYALFGLGSLDKDRTLGGGSRDGYADAGAGMLVKLRSSADTGRALSLRADLRVRHDDADEGSRIDRMLGIGLQFAFGSGSSSPEASVAAAPAAVPPPSAPVDGDGDGVVDDRDRCPNTRSGAPVNLNGCEPQEEIRLLQITFEHDSDRLRPEAFGTLAEAVETLRRNSDLRIEVAGYTDDSGSDAYNLALSQRRAEAVRRYLIDRGVTNALAVRGYGEREPVADNGTEAGRSQNRRVVLLILSP
jgi:OmpA-OmpF porin, OOP family